MKYLFLSALFVCTFQTLQAQVPQFFNYQAIARDSDHKPLGNADISVTVNIMRNGNVVYTENDNLITAATGLFTIQVGKNNPTVFQNIDWRLGGYELQVHVSGAIDLDTPATPIISVPYALLAKEVLNEKQQLTLNGNQLSISGGNTVTLNTSGTGGTVTVGPTLKGDGSSSNPLSLAPQGAANGQVLKWNGTTWAPANDITGGGQTTVTVTLPGLSISGNSGSGYTLTNTGDTDPTDDITQTSNAGGDLSGTFNNLQIKSGVVGSAELNGMGASSGQVLKWNGTAWAPAADITGGGQTTVSVNQPGLSISGNASAGYTISNTGDTDPLDDLIKTTLFNGDITGKYDNLQVGAHTIGTNELMNNAVGTTQIIDGSITLADLANGIIPMSLPPNGAAGGDLGGTYPNPIVAQIQGRPIAATAPTDGQVLQWNNASNAWKPVNPVTSGWSLTGNGNTNPGTNFIGTTDDQPIAFKVNGTERMRLDNQGRLSLSGPDTTNTVVGFGAGLQNTGRQNSFFGNSAGALNKSGRYNSFFGQSTGASNITGNQNCLFGYGAGYNNTSSKQCFFGFEAGFQNINGGGNSFFGYQSGYSNTTGFNNTAIGFKSFMENISGFYNVAIGETALGSCTEGFSNTSVGNESLFSTTTGFDNSAVGYDALYSNTTGFSNTAIGYNALYYNTTGFSNTAVGFEALNFDTTGNYNTAIGYSSGPVVTSGDISNSTAIGAFATVSSSNTIALGDASISSIKGQVGFTTYSDARIKTNIHENVPGLAFIQKLRPVTYHYDIHRQNSLMGLVDTAMWEGKYDIEQKAYSGFIAQEVEQSAQSLGYDFSGVDAPANDRSLYGLRYAEFTVPLVKAVQEQQAIIDQLKTELADMKAQLTAIRQQLKTDKVQIIKIKNDQTLSDDK